MTDPSGNNPTNQNKEKPDGLEDLEPTEDPKGGRGGFKLPNTSNSGGKGSGLPLEGCCSQGCQNCEDLGGVAIPTITGIKY